jgi:hypothetical protein
VQGRVQIARDLGLVERTHPLLRLVGTLAALIALCLLARRLWHRRRTAPATAT